MRKFLFLVTVLLVVSAGMAQENKETNSAKPAASNEDDAARLPYRLDYVIKEMDDGKVVNTRNYSFVLQSSKLHGVGSRSYGEVKTGTRVPVTTAAKDGGSSIQYIDVGINIQAALLLMENSGLLYNGTVEISTLASGPESTGPTGAPVIRQMRCNINGEVVSGKSNLLASLDDPISKHRFVIEVTPTKLR